MAIYDVNAIMESEQPEGYVDEEVIEEEAEAVLDNMLEACDQMMSALEESGGAHQRYAKMLADKDKAIKDKIDKANYIGTGSNAHKKLVDKYQNQRGDLASKARKYIDGGESNGYPSDAIDAKRRTEDRFGNKIKNSPYHKIYRHAKDNFKKDFGGPGGEDPMVAKQKLHDAKKKAIKETCLSILSVLDEL